MRHGQVVELFFRNYDSKEDASMTCDVSRVQDSGPRASREKRDTGWNANEIQNAEETRASIASRD